MSILKVNTIQDKGGNTLLSSDGAGTLTLPSDLKNTPAFEVYLSSSQTISHASFTKLQINTEIFDTDSCYDNTTNYRFTPTTAGKYFVYANVMISGSGGNNLEVARIDIYKNGSRTKFSNLNMGNYDMTNFSVTITDVVDMNGSTDYLELYGYGISQTSANITIEGGGAGDKHSTFGAYRIIGA
mgnify:CR=1 FL=1